MTKTDISEINHNTKTGPIVFLLWMDMAVGVRQGRNRVMPIAQGAGPEISVPQTEDFPFLVTVKRQ